MQKIYLQNKNRHQSNVRKIMIDILLNFAKKAGQEIKKSQKNIQQICNKNASVASVVTTTDVLISDMFSKTIEKNFSHLNYMIVDEEKISQYGNKVFDSVKKTEYQFVIDPIDGTIQFANNHPLYGISIGVYKNAKPYMGIIYMPDLNQLIYSDGKKVFKLQNAFKKNQIKEEILPKEKSDISIIFAHYRAWEITEKFSFEENLIFNYFSAVAQSYYVLTGNAKTYCMHLRLWDIAGTMPIAYCLGMKIFEYGISKVYDKISAQYFTEELHTQKHCVLCYPADYQSICEIVKPKQYKI